MSFSTRTSKLLHLKSHTSKDLWHTFIDPDFKIFIHQKQEEQSSEEYTSMFYSSEHYSCGWMEYEETLVVCL